MPRRLTDAGSSGIRAGGLRYAAVLTIYTAILNDVSIGEGR
jgi:hypothetical protein